MALLTVAQAAARLDVSTRRVRALIAAGRLPAEKLGRDWLIEETSLARVSDRKPGPPLGNRNAAKEKK